MNYEIHTENYVECGITPTNEPANGFNIFDTFPKAKKTYLSHLRCSRDAWASEVSYGLKLTKKDIDKYYG